MTLIYPTDIPHFKCCTFQHYPAVRNQGSAHNSARVPLIPAIGCFAVSRNLAEFNSRCGVCPEYSNCQLQSALSSDCQKEFIMPARSSAFHPADSGHNGILATDVLRLLDEAGNAFDRDLTKARSFIEQARAMLTGTFESPPSADGGGLAPWQVKRIEAFIENNIEESFRAEDLAAVARLSVSHFSRAFRRSFDESPHAYILSRRIGYAQHLLLSTDQPLSQVAICCGMADQAHFSRLFRKLTGETPSRWRRARKITG
jgi:AraC-like DNA-binding protein